MAEFISLVFVFGLAFVINVVLKKLGFEPEPNPYFGDYEESVDDWRIKIKRDFTEIFEW